MALARRLRLMLTALFVAMAAAVAFNFMINPFGAWHHRLIPNLYRRLNHERLMTPYLLHTVRPHTLLLGSSRVLLGLRIDQGEKDGYQNAALPAAHLEEIGREVEVALRNPHLRRVMWGVEFYNFNELDQGFDRDTRERLNGNFRLKLTDTVLSTDALVQSWRLAARAATGKATDAARMPIPWPAPFVCALLAAPADASLAGLDRRHRIRQVENLHDYARFRYSTAAMQSLAGIADRIQAAHLELIVFIPPLTQYELEMIRQSGRWSDFQRWKRDLAQHVSYWDFAGYGDLARSEGRFIDVWHMQPVVGAMIMRRLLSLPDCDCEGATTVLGSALWVTRANAAEMLALQERRAMAAEATPNEYSRTVATAIAKRHELPGAALSARR